jgi:hypothetical protein
MSTAKKTNPSLWSKVVGDVKSSSKGVIQVNGQLVKRSWQYKNTRLQVVVTKVQRRLITV